MNVIYTDHYNIDLGLLNYLHPFDGCKFRKIYNALKKDQKIRFIEPESAMSMEVIDQFLTSIMRHRVRNRNGIFQALEVPRIPFINFSFLDKRILTPMRWGVAGTLLGASRALQTGELFWNVSGGYHHAMPQNMEGFCIYNDIGITHQQLLQSGQLKADDKILIIDVDAHHGNGNAQTFMDNPQVTILDVYNAAIYPRSPYTRERVDIAVPLTSVTFGKDYLEQYSKALNQITDDYRLAFVVAGTDVLASDKLGGLNLMLDDVAKREQMTVKALAERSTPAVILGGGGYSKESAHSVIQAIRRCAEDYQSQTGL